MVSDGEAFTRENIVFHHLPYYHYQILLCRYCDILHIINLMSGLEGEILHVPL